MNTSWAPSRWLPATLIALAVLSTAVASLGTPLLPAVQHTYGVTLADSQWTLTITLLVGAIVTPVMGRLGSGSAHRATTIVAVAGMAAGCAFAALPLDFSTFLIGRALQGLGLGLVPLATATARTDLPQADRARVMATIGVTTAAGIGIGYPVVGLLAQWGGVSLPFWFVTLLSLVCLVAVCRTLPHSSGRRSRIDVVSTILLATGLSLVLLVLSEGTEWGWRSVQTITLLAVGLALLAGWAFWELRTRHPLIDLRMLRHPAVAAANISVFLIAIGFYPLAPLVVRLIQTPTSTGYGFGADVVIAGLMLTPFSFASFVASRLVHPILKRLSAETVVAIACLFPFASFLVFWFARSSYLDLLLAMALNGLGIGCVYAVNPLQISVGVPATETAAAMSTYQLNRSIAYSIGSALSATLLITGMPKGATYPDASGYSIAAIFGVVILIAALITSGAFAVRRHRQVTPPQKTA